MPNDPYVIGKCGHCGKTEFLLKYNNRTFCTRQLRTLCVSVPVTCARQAVGSRGQAMKAISVDRSACGAAARVFRSRFVCAGTARLVVVVCRVASECVHGALGHGAPVRTRRLSLPSHPGPNGC